MRAPRPRRRSESLHRYCLSDVEIGLGSDTLTYFTELPSENLTQFVYAFICVSKCLCPLKLGHCLISDSNCGKEWLLCPGLRGNRLNPLCLSYPVIVFDCIHLRSSNRKENLPRAIAQPPPLSMKCSSTLDKYCLYYFMDLLYSGGFPCLCMRLSVWFWHPAASAGLLSSCFL